MEEFAIKTSDTQKFQIFKHGNEVKSQETPQQFLIGQNEVGALVEAYVGKSFIYFCCSKFWGKQNK